MNRSYHDWFIIYLSQQEGIGWHTLNVIVKQNLVYALQEWSFLLLKKWITQDERAHKLVDASRKFSHEAIALLKEDEDTYGYKSILWNETDYPAILRECVQPPWVIYIKGRTELLHTAKLAIVGTRAPSIYGCTITKQFARELSQMGYTIVSGLAGGIDTLAHESSIEHLGSTVAVLPCGIKHCYPTGNVKLYRKIERDGLLISESVHNKQVHKGLFSQRNRIIAGLAYATIVVEGEIKSGSMITAKFTQEMDRELYAVPGSLLSSKSSGPNFLIYKGYARMLLNSTQIHEDLPWLAQQLKTSLQHELKHFEKKNEEVKKVILLEEENIVLQHIRNHPQSIDDLVLNTPFSYEQLNVIVLQLIIKQCIRLHHGSLYIAL